MTGKFNNVYIQETSLVGGFLERDGLYSKYFDKCYDNYNIDSSFEMSDVKLSKDALLLILKKAKLSKEDISLIVGGDLLNQICATSYAISTSSVPFLGVFSACATSMESIIIASKFIEDGSCNNAICLTSSHNLAEEKQFRNPTEYGYTKPKTATFTSTGGAAILLSSSPSKVKISNYTIGKIVDMGQNDPNNMGAVMAPAAGDTIYKHLTDLNIEASYYDLILTGDLGIYGKAILKDYMKENYNINLNNYDDCGSMIYDMKNQKEITAGGSGPVASALINYGYIYDMLKKGKYKKVLFVTTGALFSPTFLFQKQNILGIAHAVSMEAIKWPMFTPFYFADFFA